MAKLMFFVMQGIALLFYTVIVVLSIIPLDPTRASRNLYMSFVLFSIIFYIIGTSLHTWLTLLICESLFDRQGKKLMLLILPCLMLGYITFVIITGT